MTTVPRRIASVAIIVLATASSLWAHATPADATFPGTDGLILFTRGHDLWTIEPDGSDPRRIIRNAVEGRWSADGKRIVFVRYKVAPLPVGIHTDLWVADADGSDRTRITRSTAFDYDPTWSPNGRWVAFASDRGGRSEIYKTRSAGGGRAIQLTSRSAKRSDYGPDWSPDGDVIAYYSVRRNRQPNLRTVAPLAGAPSTLVTHNFSKPSWSPDGSRIMGAVFDRTGFMGIVHVDPDGGDHVEVGDGSDAWRGEDPVWSPEGDRMAYTLWSDTNDFTWLYVAPVNGDDEPAAVLGDPDGGIRDPDWQPAVI